MIEYTSDRKKGGIIYAVLANVIWGILPLYWKLLSAVSAFEVLAHRIVWSLVFVAVILTVKSEWASLKKIIKNKKSMIYISICAVIICINWGLYIWSVSAGRLVDASMGYFINPLVLVILGVIVLKEKIGVWEYVALGMAGFGVVYIGIHYGSIPWVALILALTFAFYGLFKKMAAVDSLAGLFLETSVLAPFFLSYLIFKQFSGTAAFGMLSWQVTLLLPLAGVFTGSPLILFAKAANRVELSTMGFLFYLTPSISLAIGVFLFKEDFTTVHAVSFGFIWAALLIYTLAKTGVLKSIQFKKEVIVKVQE